MISKQDLERILQREGTGRPVLSLFLDMTVNSDNKRTHSVFLSQKRSQAFDLDFNGGSRTNAVAVNALFDRIEGWLGSEFSEENRGVVVYAEVGGDWFEVLQFPVAVANRLVVAERPFIAPLAQVVNSYHHHGVVLLDREHVRILSVYLGTLLDEIQVQGEPWPAPSDIQAGGYSQKRFQRRKAEETKHFFKEFAKELEDFTRRYQPDDLVILGTDENVSKFQEFLPESLLSMISYTGSVWVDEPASQVMAEIEPHLRAERARESKLVVQNLRDRVREDYMATSGFPSTLTALQEGKVDTLVIAQDQDRDGARCSQCGFVFAREVESCPYDGSKTTIGVNVVEEAIRLAETQGADVEFVPASDVEDLRGVGALLRF